MGKVGKNNRNSNDNNNELNVSHAISKEIAEYATENCYHCSNNKCKHEIAILNEYIQQYNCNHDNSQQLGFKYCSHSNKFYCNKCMTNAISIHCHCDENNKCTTCNSIMKHCNCHYRAPSGPQPCEKCLKMLNSCNHCVESGERTTIECIKCQKMCCDDCYTHCIYNACICKECEEATNVKCGNMNCENVINLLCHQQFENECICESEWISICENCNTAFCDDCFVPCKGCKKSFCEKCINDIDNIIDFNPEEGECICDKCDECDTIIECNECNIKYKLLCKSNLIL